MPIPQTKTIILNLHVKSDMPPDDLCQLVLAVLSATPDFIGKVELFSCGYTRQEFVHNAPETHQ